MSNIGVYLFYDKDNVLSTVTDECNEMFYKFVNDEDFAGSLNDYVQQLSVSSDK